MYGLRWEGELWFHRWHMWPVPSSSTPSVAVPSNSFVFIDTNSFSKDGRKIHVGDCALFKPSHDSLPFVGIIRRLIVGKENNLSLTVNWLYRPADVKLEKGASLEAAPNEVFYSFHKDEIPAASLLHPCKVTFLRKVVELPSGISSFVCRRVYDIKSKRLWWLTDQDYINSYLTQERQEEVDQLLDKTRIEMYGAVQTGGRSPKPLNGPNGTSQLKPSSDNVQNSSSSISSHTKSKKREHSVHNSDSVKRERLSKVDDADSGQLRSEHIMKTEIAKITDKGGLVDFGGVEKLIQLMRPESAEKKLDLACRAMLVDVISGTERFDCLGRFVQLRGLSVLDEWLQEIHKGKIGDGSPKENDKSVEEFLFSLLRALDRLPVNLHALQTCNVGKSVNHLRSHKNSEIQKKARSLVSTWKSRVEAEMNIIETKSNTSRGGFWPSKSMISEVSHMGSRRIGGSSEVSPKSSTPQPSGLKVQQPKHNSGEAISKSPASPSSTKLSALAAAGGGSSDMPSSAAKEGRSCSSSQSPNNSQSCSSDHGKTVASCREDARSTVAGSSSVSKISSSVSHSRNSSNGFHGSTIPGVQKEGSLGKIGSVNRNVISEKGSPTGYTSERVSDVSLVDNGNSQKLIVRILTAGRSPARTVSGESPEDSSTISGKASVVVPSERQDHYDQKVSGKIDVLQGNNVPNTDANLSRGKDGLVGHDEVKVVTAGLPFDERGRVTEASLGSGSSSGVTPKSGKLYEASYSSINALVESCAKFSEASVSPSVGDDVGMNLLASVAAGEMSRSDVSPACSPGSNSPLPEDSCSANVAKLRREDNIHVANGHTLVDQISSVDSLSTKSRPPQQTSPVMTHISGDSKDASFGCDLKTREVNTQLDSPIVDLPHNGNAVVMAPEVKPAGLMEDKINGCKEGDGAVQSEGQRKFSSNWPRSVNFSNMKPNSRSSSSDEDKNGGCAEDKAAKNNIVLPDAAATSVKIETQANEESASWSSSDMRADDKKLVHKQSSSSNLVLSEELRGRLKGENSTVATTSCGDVDLVPKSEEVDDKKTGSHAEQIERQNMDSGTSVSQRSPDEPLGRNPGGSVPTGKPPQELRSCEKPTDVAEMAVKLDFDLNEVLPNDDGIQVEVERSLISGNLAAIHSPSPLPSNNGNRSSLITVAAAAKGPFCSSENLSRGKTELGWKGSAATSAFRPAEPRKTSDVPVPDNNGSKQARPLLDFDLNVGAVEDAGQNNRALNRGGLDLDLNACEESSDVVQLSVFNSGRPGGIEQLPPRSLQSRGFFTSESNLSRGFDLNNGPGVEEGGGESVSFSKNSMQFLSAVPNVKMNNMDIGNFLPWFPPNNAYPAITIPSIHPVRGDPSYPIASAAVSQRMLAPVTATTSLNPELFRGGPVLSSSPAVAFPSTVPFQYSAFPFETNFSVPSISNTFSAVSTAYVDSSSSGGTLCFPTIPSQTQLVGPNGVVSMPYRPYFMSLPGGGSSTVGPDGRKWGSQGLDLNAGPGGSADDKLGSGLRPIPLTGSQAMDDEQLKMFQQMAAGSGVSKRKEPDGGWDGDRINYKRHPSWQ